MKLIIASDIHGNVYYTKKLCELITKENPDNIILLGDHLAFSSWDDDFDEHQVANLLNNYHQKIISVRGNCDSDELNNLLIFDNSQKYREINIDGTIFSLTHGHLINALPFLQTSPYLISGHSHVYSCNLHHLNPGSVGLPRINKEHTCFLYQDKTFFLINLDDFTTIDQVKLL